MLLPLVLHSQIALLECCGVSSAVLVTCATLPAFFVHVLPHIDILESRQKLSQEDWRSAYLRERFDENEISERSVDRREAKLGDTERQKD